MRRKGRAASGAGNKKTEQEIPAAVLEKMVDLARIELATSWLRILPADCAAASSTDRKLRKNRNLRADSDPRDQSSRWKPKDEQKKRGLASRQPSRSSSLVRR
jgi:hypothetical protein